MRPPTPDTQLTQLLDHLRVEGPCASSELCAALQVSQPTLSRLIRANPDPILVTGKGRATRYFARRAILGLPAVLPVHRVDEAGASVPLGVLHPVWPRGHVFVGAPDMSGTFEDLPWFLQAMRPAGFLGRLVPAQHPELGFADDVRVWTGDQVLVWLARFAHDVTGDLIVGEEALRRRLNAPLPAPVPPADRPVDYALLAERAISGGEPGSSGGEQPKFLAVRQSEAGPVHVLVKFSPPDALPVSRRIADLLRLEALALEVVGQRGYASAKAEIVEGGGRVFLEVERFDRVGAQGRRGVVPLDVLDDEWVGQRHSWTATVEALRAQGRVVQTDVEAAIWLDRFGLLIGNTDRHGGNLSFFLEEGRVGRLTPLYDMLPMAWMPRGNELVQRRLTLPSLSPQHPELWWGAWRAALDFWGRALIHSDLAEDTRLFVQQSLEAIQGLEPLLTRLPRGASRA